MKVRILCFLLIYVSFLLSNENFTFSRISALFIEEVEAVKVKPQKTILTKLSKKEKLYNNDSTIRDVYIPYNANVEKNTPDTQITVKGNVSYERLIFERIGEHYHFNSDSPISFPSRFMTVNLLSESDNVVDRTTTNNNGDYELKIDSSYMGKNFRIEVVAHLSIDTSAGEKGVTAQVLSQKNGLYAHRTDLFYINSDLIHKDVYIESGTHESTLSYESSRISAPFAILDTVLKGIHFLSYAGINLKKSLPILTINWSFKVDENNPPTSEGPGAYYSGKKKRIYLGGITEGKQYSKQWQERVILHEFAHFYMDVIVGYNTLDGGIHYLNRLATLPLALSEGFANAFAFAVLDDWTFIYPSSENKSNSGIPITLDLKSIAQLADPYEFRDKVAEEGYLYHEPKTNLSAFSEITVCLFILSIISEHTEETTLTTNLESHIGMLGLHNAFLKAKNDPALFTIYSVVDILKQQNLNFENELNDLGKRLDIIFYDKWGTNQDAFNTHYSIYYQKKLPPSNYLPIYRHFDLGQYYTIQTNTMLSSPSKYKPGSVVYAKFTADGNKNIRIKVGNSSSKKGKKFWHELRVILNNKVIKNEITKRNSRTELEFITPNIFNGIYVLQVTRVGEVQEHLYKTLNEDIQSQVIIEDMGKYEKNINN